MANRNGDRKIQILERAGITWMNVSAPTKRTIERIRERFPHLLDIDLLDCLPPFQRPKLLVRKDYLFMVLLFPIYDERLKAVRAVEVDLFVGKDFIVTSHAEELPALAKLADACAEDDAACHAVIGTDTGKVLHSVIHELQTSVFPIITRVSNDIFRVEAQLFDDLDHGITREILRIKSNIVQCRQALLGQRQVIKKCIDAAGDLFDTTQLRVSYEDLIGHSQEIWDYLENDKETIDAIHDSHLSLVGHATNDAMRKLAAMGLVVVPAGIMASIFGMNAEHMPFQGGPYDFWIMVSTIALMMSGTFVWLRRNDWL